MPPRRPRFRIASAFLFALTLLLTVPAGHAWSAKKPPAKPAGPMPGADMAGGPGGGDKPYADWKKVTKDAEVRKGFFTLYQKRENLYMQINADQMDTPVLAITSLARGVGMNGVLGGLPQNDQLLEFHRSGDHVLVMQQNTRFTAPNGSPVERAKDLSMGNSVVASLKIESVQDSTKAVLVDLAPMIVSDMPDIAEQMRFAFGNKPMRFDKDRSALGTVKVFPENIEIEATLTYSPNDRTGLNVPTVPDERYIPVGVHYSFSKLPAKPMMPRIADDRTGYFLTVMKDFSRDDKEHFFVRYVNHWRLEKKDPGAAVSEPVKPIVYYLDRTIPERYRPYIREGIERWQRAFEAAGFKHAIIAMDAPNDPDWDPEDVRYSTIRWITSSPPSFGAIGPSRVDPRTGEILDADILIEASIVQRRWRNYVNLMGNPVADEAGGMGLAGPEYRCDLMSGIAGSAALANIGMAMASTGNAAADSALREKFIGEMLIHTTLHEVGHTLGLRHNFRSSTATPEAKLNDRDWTTQHGLMGSVMDYAAVNLAAEHGTQGEYYATWPGTVDDWMIRYGYAPSGASTPDADYAYAKTIADESEQPGHEYSTDEDTGGPFSLDPRTNQFDLGDDPLTFAKERSAMIAALWKSPNLENRLVGASGEYPVLRRAVDGLLEQYGITVGLAVKYVGGQYQSRDHRGQPGAKDPLVPVPAVRQREALDFLADRVFSANAFTMAPGLLNKLGPDRWSHWGVNENFGIFTGPRLDYNLNDKALAIQTGVLDALMSGPLMARLREAESRSPDAFRLSEHFDRMTRMVWGDAAAGPAALKALEGPGTRREVQRAYVDRLATLLVAPPNGTPDDARALARLQLSRIDSRCSRLLAAATPMGDYARAHLMETRARIKRALEAGRDIETASGQRPGGPFGQP